MAKWFSFAAFIIAAAAAYFVFQTQPLVDKLQAEGAAKHKQLEATAATLKKTNDVLVAKEAALDKTYGELTDTKKTLADTKAELDTTKGKLATAEGELNTTKTQLAEIKQQIEAAIPGGLEGVGNLKTAIESLKTAKETLEKEVADAKKRIGELDAIVATLTESNKGLTEENTNKTKVIKKYAEGIMEQGIRGRVLAVNSGWGFVVTSLGDKQGAASNKILIVTRGGQAIGKVKISNIEANQSIADILPGSFVSNTYVQPGDGVIYVGNDQGKTEQNTTPAPGVNPPLPN